ncbi:MAG TPA: hypothetical protein VIY71_07955, partial [Solirubrobacterales bacterium]
MATVGTAAIAGIGYSKLADVFPWGGPCLAYVALGLGVAAMLTAVLVLVHRFDGSTESVFTSTDLQETFDRNGIKDKDEKKLIRRVYWDTANLNRVGSLSAYERRAQRFERIANRAGGKRAEELRGRADQILTETIVTQDRAAALLLRDRANQAMFGPLTVFMIILFISGWYATAVGADALQSERKDQIELAKSCAEARGQEEIIEEELPASCGKPEAEKAEDKTPVAKVAREGFKSLAAALDTCLETAEENKEEKTGCAWLEGALKA